MGVLYKVVELAGEGSVINGATCLVLLGLSNKQAKDFMIIL